ncbi:unnamed protein product [Eruca vesicaria subsp. sativa]|uniref:Uncharacterized protein n=1 Tax=Eruca vesicaria subsp. sativa TaxID=29727 RepID=A0ABC8JGW9_ERUVS|nr:unnamed protein product [Eruca vesicaria subsp. sativa]
MFFNPSSTIYLNFGRSLLKSGGTSSKKMDLTSSYDQNNAWRCDSRRKSFRTFSCWKERKKN